MHNKLLQLNKFSVGMVARLAYKAESTVTKYSFGVRFRGTSDGIFTGRGPLSSSSFGRSPETFGESFIPSEFFAEQRTESDI